MSEATGQVKAATAKPSTFPRSRLLPRARPRRSRHIQSCAVNRCHRMCRLRFYFCGVLPFGSASGAERMERSYGHSLPNACRDMKLSGA